MEAYITKDIEPYTIVGGNPGEVIRKRFDDETTDLKVV
jgi:acetyltransferase-like isoleucine patch superfamily enzyme